jgi:chromate transporter
LASRRSFRREGVNDATGEAAVRPPGLGALFVGFFSVGMLGFGGVLPLARRMIVERRRWLSPAEFTDLLALCQVLPGANITNVSVALGGRFGGPAGALAALAGLLVGPVSVVLVVGALYDRYGAEPVVAHGIAGMAAAASGLVLATALRIAAPLRGRPRGIAAAAAAFVALAVLRLPLLVVLVVLLPAAVLLRDRTP